MKPDLEKQIADLTLRLNQLADVHYRIHSIDKDVFSNPVFIRSRFILPDLAADPGIGQVGELCMVGGVLKRCTVSSTTSATWVAV